MYRLNTTLKVFVSFRDLDGVPHAPDNVSLTILKPDETTSVTVLEATEVVGLYSTDILLNQVGVWSYVGTSTDLDVSYNEWHTLRVQPHTELPTLGEIVSALSLQPLVVVNPLVSADTMLVVIGDDYEIVDGRQFEWSVDESLDLTDATILWTGAGISKAMSLEDDKIILELSHTDTEDINPARYRFSIRATLESGNIITLLNGDVIMNLPEVSDCG